MDKRDGILMSIGNILENLSQQILVGIILVERVGVLPLGGIATPSARTASSSTSRSGAADALGGPPPGAEAICMHIYIYRCIYIYIYICMYVCMYACMHACMHACMYVCMHVCMHACMYVCMYSYMCVYVCIYIYIYTYVYIHILSMSLYPSLPHA